jgi:DNA-binding NarL/FixJ family response regulator
MAIAVSVVEDHPDIRMGIGFTLRSFPGYRLVGEYGSAEECLKDFDQSRPDVIIMDINLPGISGIEATARIKNEYPRTEIVILSVLEDDDHVFRAICAGASGYVTKPILPAQLTEAIDQVFSGGTPMSPHIARKVVDLFRQHIPPPRADYLLTTRELEVLELLTQGDDYKLIAEKLFLSIFTVRAHIRNIYDKLHVHSKSQAVAKALKEKVLPTR